MANTIMFDISPEKSEFSNEDREFQKEELLNQIQLMSVKTPELFETETPQRFQQTMEFNPFERKQNIVKFEEKQPQIKRQTKQWTANQKENINHQHYRTVTESKERLRTFNKRGSQKDYMNLSQIEKTHNQSMVQDLIELDLPALISQMTQKRKAIQRQSVNKGQIQNQAVQIRQPGKIVNQKQLKSYSVAIRKQG